MHNLYIFDCFGVVVSDVSTLWMSKHFSNKQIAYARKEIYRKVDCGEMTFEHSFDLLGAMCNLPADVVKRQWDECMFRMPQTEKILAKLKSKNQTVALLTNASETYVNSLFNQFGLYKYFDKIFISATYKTAKPDRQFYEICLNSFTEKFDKIYFTDDNPNNLLGLENLGITPVLFTSARQLKKDLNLV